MFKSSSKQPAAHDLATSTNADNNHVEQQQARHRTAIRIVGIEGIEAFADVAEPRTEPGDKTSR